MPIFWNGNPASSYEFRCINWQLPSHMGALEVPIDSMEADPLWLTLVGVEPAMARPGPGVLHEATIPQINLRRGQPVRIYRCRICGYIEMYDAHSVDPNLWGP